MGKKILIIDDNKDDLFMMERFLNEAGFNETITAEDGDDGVRKAEKENPDLVISDTRLPGIDGFEVCRRIRKSRGPECPKIIIVTGSIDAVDAVTAKKAGADDYCAKTSDQAPLVEAVKMLI